MLFIIIIRSQMIQAFTIKFTQGNNEAHYLKENKKL